MKRWYVAQVFAGYEEAVRNEILRRVDEQGLSDLFGEVLIPSAKLKQYFEQAAELDAKKQDQQLFPGYILVEMESAPETIRLVASTPRLVRFLGGTDPVPLAKREVDRIFSQVKGEVAIAPKKSEFVVGREIEIGDGPFSGFVGIIDSINDEAERLIVNVSIFGRMTPVELSFNQVKQ
jgi:transcriptional antiterminator NusG